MAVLEIQGWGKRDGDECVVYELRCDGELLSDKLTMGECLAVIDIRSRPGDRVREVNSDGDVVEERAAETYWFERVRTLQALGFMSAETAGYWLTIKSREVHR